MLETEVELTLRRKTATLKDEQEVTGAAGANGGGAAAAAVEVEAAAEKEAVTPIRSDPRCGTRWDGNASPRVLWARYCRGAKLRSKVSVECGDTDTHKLTRLTLWRRLGYCCGRRMKEVVSGVIRLFACTAFV